MPLKNLATACELCSYSEAGNLSREADGESRRISRMVAVRHPRLTAAFWFACAACVPGLILFLFIGWRQAATSFALVVTLLPASLSCFFGALIGWAILDSSRVMSGLEAFVRGLVVAFLSFATVAALITLALFYFGPSSDRVTTNIIVAFMTVLIYGFVLVGWWATLLGGLAGCLCYVKYR